MHRDRRNRLLRYGRRCDLDGGRYRRGRDRRGARREGLPAHAVVEQHLHTLPVPRASRNAKHAPHLRFEPLQILPRHVQLPLEVPTHLAFHLINFPEREHALANDGPGLVGVGVVADDLGGEHEGGKEEAMARRAAGVREAGFEAVEEGE